MSIRHGSNSDTLNMYPFDFELYVEYNISEDTLETKYRVINKSKEDMVFGIGGHPGFKIDTNHSKYYFRLNKKEDNISFMEVDGDLISSNSSKNLLVNKDTIILDENSFINDAIMMKEYISDKIVLFDSKDDSKILEFDFKSFPILAIWTMPNAPFICIEPWFNTADKTLDSGIFNEKEGMITLKKQEEFICSYSVKFF